MPEDKQLLVETLNDHDNIVSITGDGANDGPAHKMANVGFSMGVTGTEIAKEASDIILMADNFLSIVKAIIWAQCVNDSVCKFLQFQITTDITAVIITFITALALSGEEGALSAVRLLWINLIMDTFTPLALVTDPALPVLLNRKLNCWCLERELNLFMGMLKNWYFMGIMAITFIGLSFLLGLYQV